MTPYEIRLELVKLAKEMLSEDFYSRRSAVERDWDARCSRAMSDKTELPPQPQFPEYFAEKDVIEKAISLNEFISNGK